MSTFLVPSVEIWKEDFVAGRIARVDFFANQGFFFKGMPAAGSGGAGLMSGTLRIDAAGTSDGDPVKGWLEAAIWQLPP